MEKINRVSLYIINVIKFLRLVLGKSAIQLSYDINKSENYVTNIESTDTVNKYNSADFSTIAEEIKCKIHDFIPSDDWDVSKSHIKVDKVVDSLKDPLFAKRVIQAIYARNTHPEALENIENLYAHFHLKKDKVQERQVVKEVWEDFVRNTIKS